MAAEIAALANREDAKRLADQLAIICKQSNPRFDFARFYAACGV